MCTSTSTQLPKTKVESASLFYKPFGHQSVRSVSGNYSCYDGGGCATDTAWVPYKTVLESIAVALLSPSCFSPVFNHPYFHFSHAIMFICYILPFGSPCQLILFIRIGLAGATTIMALWARNVQCWVDSLLWNTASAVVNIIYILVLFYQLRPIKFNDELEQVNNFHLFENYSISYLFNIFRFIKHFSVHWKLAVNNLEK